MGHSGLEDFAVAHLDGAVCVGGGFGVVGDHEDGLAEALVEVAEEIEDDVGIFGVEIAGGLVGEEDGGTVDDGAGDGDALLLATGECAGLMLHTGFDAEHVQDFFELSVEGDGAGGDVTYDLDVLLGGEGGEQVVLLEDEAYGAFAEVVTLRVGHLREVATVDGDGAGGWRGEAAEDVEEGRLAGAGGADDGEEFTACNLKVDPLQGIDADFADAEGFGERADLDDGGVEGERGQGLEIAVGLGEIGLDRFGDAPGRVHVRCVLPYLLLKSGFFVAGSRDGASVVVDGAGFVDAG